MVKNLSKGTGKIVLKAGRIGIKRDWEEIEVPLHIGEVDRMANLFSALNLQAQLIHNGQKRHNFLYKGVEIALKYSDDWGYHVELEVVINDKKDQELAVAKIKEIAEELNLKLMTEEEELAFTQKIEADYRKKDHQKTHL